MSIFSLKNILLESEARVRDSKEDSVEQSPPIYLVMEILDKYKSSGYLRKVYNAHLDYERLNNKVALIIRIDNLKKFKELNSILKSEYFREMISNISNANASRWFTNKLLNSRNYSLHCHGEIGIFKTDFLKIS